MTLASPCMVHSASLAEPAPFNQFRMFLRKMTGASKPSAAANHRGHEAGQFTGVSGGREGEIGVGFKVTVRAACLTGRSASAERLVDDAHEGARAAAAFGAAAEATIELLGAARKDVGRVHGVADVVIGQHVAGTDNH